MTHFTAYNGAVCLGGVRFDLDQVKQLMTLFAKEREWDLYDEVLMARDVIVEGLTPEPPTGHREAREWGA